ncbi:DMT family transporter [uncultured Tateyamaria sp.]|uniref:DMT family transporter n=1 Tax=uncultured Tateyamaria sp. TaxID=455651 RepID=UPI002626524A|nr:DMT family transporter [uncultured Tateyamaria sp.]
MLIIAAQVFVATTCIVLGDAAGKALTASGFDPFFVAWTRFACAAIALAPFCGLSRDSLPVLLDRRVILRAALIAAGICSILTALSTTPLPDVFGAFFIGPVVAFVLSALLLGERINTARALLLALGFGGVMLVVKPGFGLTTGIGFALLAGLFYGCFLVATRWLSGTVRPRLLLFSQLSIGAVLLTPLGLAATVPTLTPNAILLNMGSAAGSAAGNFLLVWVSRSTPASIVAPLIYTQLISATAVGLILFNDWPDILTLVGLVVILASGLGSLWLARSVH